MTQDMTSVRGGGSAAPSGVLGPDNQLPALRELGTQLDQAAEWLKEGNGPMLSTMAPTLSRNADGLRLLWLQAGSAGLARDAEVERRKLLSYIAKRRRFCRGMLRRWRRGIVLQEQVLGLEANRVSYGEWLGGAGS